jgi:hypothetical protein
MNAEALEVKFHRSKRRKSSNKRLPKNRSLISIGNNTEG